jgi:hypothetical protein
MRRKVNNPQELERALDDFVGEQGGTKELVTYRMGTKQDPYKGNKPYKTLIEVSAVNITLKKESK